MRHRTPENRRKKHGKSEIRQRDHCASRHPPYNGFVSEGGKVWDRLKGVAEANQCVPHITQVLDAPRKADIGVFYALHRRYRAGDYETWKYIAPALREQD